MFSSRFSRVGLQLVRAIGRTNTKFAATLRHKNNLSILARGLCTAPKEEAKDPNAGNQGTSIARRMIDNDGYDDYETTEKQAHAKDIFGLAFIAMIISLCSYGGYMLYSEMFGRMAPNTMFNETFEIIRIADEIVDMTGDPMKAYGMDVARHTEGRRYRVASRQYKAVDGSNRSRIRYTVAGPRGKAYVYAEVSSNMKSGEYVYLIVQDAQSGRVVTMRDERARLEAEMNANSNESKSAISALLGGRN